MISAFGNEAILKLGPSFDCMRFICIFIFVLSDDLRRQNEIMKSEVEMLQIRLKQYSQLQELTAMLQESHKYVHVEVIDLIG